MVCGVDDKTQHEVAPRTLSPLFIPFSLSLSAQREKERQRKREGWGGGLDSDLGCICLQFIFKCNYNLSE